MSGVSLGDGHRVGVGVRAAYKENPTNLTSRGFGTRGRGSPRWGERTDELGMMDIAPLHLRENEQASVERELLHPPDILGE